MGITAQGQLTLTQQSEEIKHIDLEIIMEFVNRLHNTRRMYRIVGKPTYRNIYSRYLKYPKDAYGIHGDYFYFDEEYFKESIEDYNWASGPSLWLPFYIQKENNNYILKCNTIPKGNDFDSIHLWLHFLHENIFYTTGIVSHGEFVFSDDETDETVRYDMDENGMFYKSPSFERHSIDREWFLQNLIDDPADKERYTPGLFLCISEDIEQHPELKKNYSFD